MKAFRVLPIFLVAVLLCIEGCGGAGSPGASAMVPGPPGPGPVGSTPTPVGSTPTPVGSTPTPSPTTAPTNVAIYQGCGVFTAGDWYNKPIAGASVDPNSANYVASVAAADSGGFYLSTGVEFANLASGSTPTHAVTATVPYHQNEFNANPPYPWMASYKIEPLSDKHAIVFTTPSNCHLFESYGTNWSGSALFAYSGWTWDLSKPFVSLPAGWPSSMASGLSLFTGAVKAEEIEAGAIKHALNWGGTAHSVAQWGFVSPASDTDGLAFSGGNANYQLPYGAHLRLKASFNDSGFGPQAKAITTALKTYGMFLADTGSSNALYGIEAQDGLNHWNSGDLAALGNLHITDFEVLSLPSIQRVPGH
jgi:hypothetical protein